MKAKLVIPLLLAIYSSTDCFVISSNNSVSTEVFETSLNISECDDTGLANITCMSIQEHEQLWGGIIKFTIIAGYNTLLFKQSVKLIGREEMRKALNLSSPLPFGHYNYTEPSEEELAAAPTLEAYYDLKEPKMKHYSLESLFFFKHNFPPAIRFLDQRVPAIRALFKCRFDEIVDKVVDRNTVDRMISEFQNVREKVYKSIESLCDTECLYE